MGVDDTARLRGHLASSLVAAVGFLATLARARRPVQGLAVVGLAAYGAWLIYHPAGYLTAAGLLLLDLATDSPTRRRADRS